MIKKSFTMRLSEEDRTFLESCYEKEKKKIEKGENWEAQWDWRHKNKSFGAWFINQAVSSARARHGGRSTDLVLSAGGGKARKGRKD